MKNCDIILLYDKEELHMFFKKVNTDLKLELYTKLIRQNHPDFGDGSINERALLNAPRRFNIEYLVEEMFELNCDGQYQFIDGAHLDFTDESDSKTGTLHANGQSSIAEITNCKDKYGTLKKGAIRAVVLNPILKKLHFFFIPKQAVYDLLHTKAGTMKKVNSIRLRYSKNKNQFTTLKKYGIIEFETFKELAMEPSR